MFFPSQSAPKEDKACLHTVGLIQSWDLANSGAPAAQFHLNNFAPYASSKTINSMVAIPDAAGPILIAAGDDAVIRVWKPDPANAAVYACVSSLYGHVRGVTGLLMVDAHLWSCSLDGCIRIWDPAAGECKHVVLARNGGHEAPITCMSLSLAEQDGTKYVLTSSLDETVRAWDSGANCMMQETHGQAVMSVNMIEDTGGNKLILCGLERGEIMIRHFPSFTLIVTLSSNYTCGHEHGAVRCIEIGQQNCFFTGGDDGKIMVWQVTGDVVQMAK